MINIDILNKNLAYLQRKVRALEDIADYAITTQDKNDQAELDNSIANIVEAIADMRKSINYKKPQPKHTFKEQ